MADAERDLIAAARRWEAGRKRQAQLDEERNEAVRRARADGVTQARVMAITGLSRPRVNQIVRRSRV